MPAGAVARHQGVLDQPRPRREAAEDDVFFQPADHFGLFFLARRVRTVSVDGSEVGVIGSLPAGQSIAILDQPQCFEIVLRRGLERRAVAQRLDEMRNGPVVGALVFDGEIVAALAGICAGCMSASGAVEPDRALVAEHVEPVDLGWPESRWRQNWQTP